MSEQWLLALREMHDAGWAVCAFDPEELGGADQEKVEDAMCEGGWDAIYFWNPERRAQ